LYCTCHKKDREQFNFSALHELGVLSSCVITTGRIGSRECRPVDLQNAKKEPRAGTRPGLDSSCALTQALKTERCGVSGDGGAAQSALTSSHVVRTLQDCSSFELPTNKKPGHAWPRFLCYFRKSSAHQPELLGERQRRRALHFPTPPRVWHAESGRAWRRSLPLGRWSDQENSRASGGRTSPAARSAKKQATTWWSRPKARHGSPLPSPAVSGQPSCGAGSACIRFGGPWARRTASPAVSVYRASPADGTAGFSLSVFNSCSVWASRPAPGPLLRRSRPT
jgi:hypothetical protein